MIKELACGRGINREVVYVTVNTSGGIDIHMTDLTPEDVQQKVNEALEQMRSGELDIEQ
jgi:hypothetical protein